MAKRLIKTEAIPVSEEEMQRMRALMGGGGVQWKTPEQGAATSVLLATSPLLEGVGHRRLG